jgi:hypothetical protein
MRRSGNNCRILKILIGLFFVFPMTSTGQNFQFSGYAKYLFYRSEYPFITGKLNDHLVHIRLNSHYYFTDNLNAALETRIRTYYGQSVEKIPGFKSMTRHHYPLGDLGWEFLNNKKLFGYAEIDRAYVDYQGQNFDLTLGRQRIAWGTSLVWNVIDLFNPMSILDFDYEERPGSDAVRFQYFTGPLSRFELAIAPHKKGKTSTWALMWASHLGEYDLYFLGGQKQQRNIFGFAWAGYIKDAGFRGEFKLSDPPSKGLHLPAVTFLPQLGTNRHTNIQAVISFDYAFPNTFYIHSEAYYNRDGVTRNASLYWGQTERVDMLSPSRWSLFQEFAYDLHPLVRADIFALFNPTDRSMLIAPSLSWSVMTNLDLYAIAFITRGPLNSEYRTYGNATFLRLKYSF